MDPPRTYQRRRLCERGNGGEILVRSDRVPCKKQTLGGGHRGIVAKYQRESTGSTGLSNTRQADTKHALMQRRFVLLL